MASIVDPSLIKGAKLLIMRVEKIHGCGLFDKAFYEWKELAASLQTQTAFQTKFQDVEEKYNLKKWIHDKKGNIGSTIVAFERNDP